MVASKPPLACKASFAPGVQSPRGTLERPPTPYSMLPSATKSKPNHVSEFEAFLGDEKYSLLELAELHSILLNDIHHRFGPSEVIHVIGKELLSFQAYAVVETPPSEEEESRRSSDELLDPNSMQELDIQDEPGGEQQPSLKAGRSEQMPRGRLSHNVRAGDDHPHARHTSPFKDPQALKASRSIENLSESDTRRSHASHTKRASFWRPANIWKRVTDHALERRVDPWAERGIHLLAMRRAVRERYRFDDETAQWTITKDEVLVKMDNKPFAAGAMRECFAMKKLSTFAAHRDWARADNMVAKSYIKPVNPQTYYDDVLLQMESKILGDAYNLTDPPKKVDFLQMCVVHLPSVQGNPIYCLEHLIEGDYIKYNSNSGFVEGLEGEECNVRNTPQAFSHFTFQHTEGRKMVVDIQGVGDLYTDPQIHTHDGVGYGEGNLGYRGMALFFRTHECNALCERMALKPFPRCDADINLVTTPSTSRSSRKDKSFNGATVLKPTGRRPVLCDELAVEEGARLDPGSGGGLSLSSLARASEDFQHLGVPRTSDDWMRQLESVPEEADPEAKLHWEVSRLGCEVVLVPELHLGDDPEDARRSAWFHLRFAAAHGHATALLVCAKWHSGSGLTPSSNHYRGLLEAFKAAGEYVEFPEVGYRCLELAAKRGVRNAAAAMGYACMTNGGMGQHLEKPDFAKAVEWFKLALDGKRSDQQLEDEASSFPGGGMQSYEIQAALGKMYMEGGENFTADYAISSECYNEAAESATEAMKGKLAQKYYEQAAIAESM